jgi:hypothetical protein
LKVPRASSGKAVKLGQLTEHGHVIFYATIKQMQ